MNVDQVVLITGAAGALGRSTAHAFRRAGAKLALLDINEQGLRSAYTAENANQICRKSPQPGLIPQP